MVTLKRDVVDGVLEVRHCIGCRQVVDLLTKSRFNSDLIRKVISEGSLEGVLEAGI